MKEAIIECLDKYSSQVIMGVVVELIVWMIIKSRAFISAFIVNSQKKALKKRVLNLIHGLRYFLPIALIAWGMVNDEIPVDRSYVVSVCILFTLLLSMVFYDILSLVILNQKEIMRRLDPGG